MATVTARNTMGTLLLCSQEICDLAPGQAMKVLPVIVLLHISKIDTASSYTSTSTLDSEQSPLLSKVGNKIADQDMTRVDW